MKSLARAEREERQGAGLELLRSDTQPVDKKVLQLPEAVLKRKS